MSSAALPHARLPSTAWGLRLRRRKPQATAFETAFPILPETPDIYPAWKALAQASGVVGKQVHDARLVAVCHVYGITHILTFNVQHFIRLVSHGTGIIVVDPSTV
ncbi:MAG: type II toxin-antitoxin system VapC family toxin [Blastocatellia bacterium]